MVKIVEASEYDLQVVEAEELLEKEDYSGAALELEKVLDQLEPHLPTVAQASLTRGKAIMTDAMNKMSVSGEPPDVETLEKVLESYELSQLLNPDCEESNFELERAAGLLRELPLPDPPKEVAEADFDVIVVGAGAAGVGTTLMLTETFGLEKSRVVMMERGASAGESFRLWPAEMKFISPSFNQQGWTNSFDLNSISNGTSPAFSLHTEHPSGNDYAKYLEAIVKKHKLNIRPLTEVVSVESISEKKDLPLFSVKIQSVPKSGEEEKEEPVNQTVTSRYIVWAAGEFQYPHSTKEETTTPPTPSEEKKSDDTEDEPSKPKSIPGFEYCIHNSSVRSWATLPGDSYIVIGGYESGIDAAVNLSRAGKQCKVLASTPCWSVKTKDPSAELAPYTAARLRDVLAPGFSPHPQLLAPLRVLNVEKAEGGGFNVTAEWQGSEEDEKEEPNLRNLVDYKDATEPEGQQGSTLVLHTPNPPILCTGFEGSVAAAASHLFEFADKSTDDDDEEEEGDDEDEEMAEVEEIDPDDEEMKSQTTAASHHHHDHPKGCLEGAPLLTRDDESTKVPGVFLVGPTVSHGSLSFCFVYKFRQRFGIVAKAICEGLGKDVRAAVSECRNNNMFLEDFSCCGDTCGDVC